MKITFNSDTINSTFRVRNNITGNAKLRVRDLEVKEIIVGTKPYKAGTWQMSLSHEMGHVLHYIFMKFARPTHPSVITKTEIMRQEVLAWRVAKSILKPELWCEREAIYSIRSYSDCYDVPINWDKFKIISWR